VKQHRFTLPAFAKINLSLRVLGRRLEDGYHEIDTLLQTTTLCDHLTFEARDDNLIEIICDASDIPTDETNLIHRAAVRLRERYQVKNAGARIELTKRIPAGGGLGGGSSDAAIALLGLARLWQIETSKNELVEIGKKIGADVPFFFTGGTARGTDTGTNIVPLVDAPARHLLIVTPNEHVSTAEAYCLLRAPVLTTENRLAILLSSRVVVENMEPLDCDFHNDFESVIFSVRPGIERAKAALMAAEAQYASLSGSGASVFGIFGSEAEQSRAQAIISRVADWEVFNCTTLTRADYVSKLHALGDYRSLLI